MGILRIIEPQADVRFENLGVNVYMRLTRAYRSLSRSSSVPKPRYPPNSVGVLASTWGKIQIACEKACVFGKRYTLEIEIIYWDENIKYFHTYGEYVPLSTILFCNYCDFTRVLRVLGPEPSNNRGIGRLRHSFPVVSGILTFLTGGHFWQTSMRP
jgi:hypothetical protein